MNIQCYKNESAQAQVFIFSTNGEHPEQIDGQKAEALNPRFSKKNTLQREISLDNYNYFVRLTDEKQGAGLLEQYRRMGSKIAQELLESEVESVRISGPTEFPEAQLLALAEGIALTAYSFEKHKAEENQTPIKLQHIYIDSADEVALKELAQTVRAVFITRDLINEPHSHQTAEQFSQQIQEIGKNCGFSVEVLEKSQIESLRMGGILGVNRGSIAPPTFNILEYKPENAVNSQPIVLVGKGVVYDTGGANIKTPYIYMVDMKCDMGGAATVVGAIAAASLNKLPIHVIGLIPATDNRPGQHAFVPGDVLTMYTGKTVEVINTDAEGRLILADALGYAKKYDPELVIDFATLTGAAMRALGRHATFMLSNIDESLHSTKTSLKAAGEQVYERLCEFPNYEEYGEELESDVADIKNLGGDLAGATAAGKFLEHFVDYPWIHLDIAGTSYFKKPYHYLPKNATGIGVRLMLQFLKQRCLEG